MINIEKLILFKAETSKYDLINNTQDKIIAVLDDMALDAKINYNLDSNHTITVDLDSDLASKIINVVGFKQIIKAKTIKDEYEYFILTDVDKVLDDTITLTGIHWVTEIVSKIFCKDLKPRDLNANLMLKHIIENSEEYKMGEQYAKDIEASGNIDTVVNCNLWQVSLEDYLEDLQELYGNCEVRKKGFMLSLMDYVGSRTPRYKVEYGKNLVSSTINEEYILVKGVLPKGYDGIIGNIVYSDKISSGITKVIEYPIRVKDDKEEDENYTYYDTLEEAQKALEDLARQEFEVNKIDEIVITYDISFLDLATTVEDGNVERANLTVGDVVNTKISQYNMDINTRVIEIDYNVLSEEIGDVVLSNAPIGSLKVPTLNSVSKEVESKPSREEVTSTARQEISDFINAGFGGYVMIYKDEIYIMDAPKKEDCVKCLRLNMNGIAGSTTGWQGPYNVAITIDGQIIADRITTGILRSLNEKTWINMEDGTFNFSDVLKLVDGKLVLSHTNGNDGVSINNGGLKFTSGSTMEEVGQIITTHLTSNQHQNGVTISTTGLGDYVQIGYGKEDGNIRTAMYFIPVDVSETAGLPWTNAGIYAYDRVYFKKSTYFDYPIYMKNASGKDHAIYNNSANGYLNILGDNGVRLASYEGDDVISRFIFNSEPTDGNYFVTYGNWNFNGGVLKNCTVSTTLDVQTISRNSNTEAQAILSTQKELRVLLEDIQIKDGQATVLNPYPNNKYSIASIVKKGRGGDVWVDTEEQDRFIIKSENDIKVNIELIIKLDNISEVTREIFETPMEETVGGELR